MAISVRDIQEKEFATQPRGGYNIEEVDDFLDEIATQLGALVRENLELTQRITSLENEVAEAKQQIPDYDEKGYFDNLQRSMKEAMASAQRIADETRKKAETDAAQIRAEAQAVADDTLATAQAEADKVTGGAQSRLEALTQQYDQLKAAAQSFKADFAGILEQQTKFLKDQTDLI